jgi:predicted component of type VI protein secretion system
MNSRTRNTTNAMRLAAILLCAALVAGTAPATASAMTETRPLEVTSKFTSGLDPDVTPVAPLEKTGADDVASQGKAEYTTPLVKAKAPLPKPVVKPATRTVRTSSTTSASSSSSSKPAASSGDTLSRARAILASRIAMYPILRGSTVELGDTKGNPQAIVYYKSGRIVINPNHTRSLEVIINHEIWHIIDWRDNGRIDWGESVPPSNAADYRG